MAAIETDLWFLTMRQAGKLMRRGELSPVELTRAFLNRIDARDGQLHAYITVMRDEALGQARAAEAEMLRGDYRGPLHGVPFALKDIYDTAGVRTTAGSKVDIDRVPTEDATTTARLKAAGAILLGKLHTYEYALGGPDFTTPFPPARNPWNLDHTTGGSSSGAGAGVAAGLCMGAMGSCTGGSIRGPASLCGIVGLKASYGRISRSGVVTLSWSQDHAGPMTWTVEDTAYMLQALAGYDPKDPASSTVPVPDYSLALREDIKGLTVGVPRHYCFSSDPNVSAEVVSTVGKGLEALQELGANIEEVTIPSLPYARASSSIIMLSEAYAFHERNLKTRPQDFGELCRARFRIGGLLGVSDYIQAQRWRRPVMREFADAFRRVDVLVTPTMTQPAPPFQGFDVTSIIRGPSFTSPFNFTGLPAISVPAGFTSDGLPVGMQVAGKPFDEATIMRVAYTYQQYARWFEQRPSI